MSRHLYKESIGIITMNQKYYQDDAEIDLIQLCKRLLVQWRAVVLVGIICGVVTMFGKYAVDMKDYQANLLASKTDVETAEESMSQDEKLAVREAVKNKELLDALSEYTENSLYFQMNPTKVRRVRCLYRVEAMNDDNAQAVIAAYREYLLSEDGLNEFAKTAGINAEANYVGELLSVEKQASDNDDTKKQIMVVSGVLPEGVDEAKMTEALNGSVAEAAEKVSAYGLSYRMDYYDTAVRSEVNYDLEKIQDEYLGYIGIIKTTLTTSTASFSEEQNLLYHQLLSQETESKSGAEENTEVLAAPGLGTKNFSIGFLLGIALYCCIYFLYIIFAPHAVELSVCGTTNLPRVGVIKISRKKKAWYRLFTYDPIINNLLFWKREKMESNPENIIGQMMVLSGNKEEKAFQLLVPGFNALEEEIMQALVEKANSFGLSLLIASVDMNNTNEVLAKLNENVPAVLVVGENETLKIDVRNLYEMLMSQKIKVLGELHVEEA